MRDTRMGIEQALSTLFALFVLASCGGGGGGGTATPAGSVQTTVSGSVAAPGGQVALFGPRSRIERFASMFASPAYAGTSGLLPVPDGTPVQLGKISSGGTFSAVAGTSTSAGRYSFDLTGAGLTFASNLIVQVAHPSSGVRMRAFVTGTAVDINPGSETAVQEVLDAIAAAPGTSLSDFTVDEVKDVVGAIDALTESSQMPSGPNVNSTISSIRNSVMSNAEITAFLASAAAAGQTAEGTGDVGNYAPLTQGNTWTFQGTERVLGQAPVSYTNTATVIGTKIIGGILTTILNQSNSLNEGGPTEDYYTKNSRGITYHGSNDPTDHLSPQLVPYLETRFPLSPGSVFEEVNRTNLDFGEDLNGDSINERLDLVSISTVKKFESITVPAGSYADCARVERRITATVIGSTTGQRVAVQSVQTSWWAPDIGLIKQVLQIDNLTVTEVLSSFAPANFEVIDLPGVSDLILDPATQTIYASARGNPGSVTPIDPISGSVGTAIQVGIDPVKLARSDNGQYLYLGLDGQPSVQRIELATQNVDLTFLLGDDPNFGPYFVEDMEVMPGNPQSVAISRRRKGVSPIHGGVAIYDNGVQRATTTPDHTGSNVIEFSSSATTLYGYNNSSTEFGFRRMAIDSSGITVQDVFTSFMGDLISGFGIDIRFHAGLIYTTTGRAIDPSARTVLGTFPLANAFGNHVVADSAIGRVFFLTNESGSWTIRAFDLTTRQELGSVTISGISGSPGSLIRWGAKGFAFRTSRGQIFLVESSDLIP